MEVNAALAGAIFVLLVVMLVGERVMSLFTAVIDFVWSLMDR